MDCLIVSLKLNESFINHVAKLSRIDKIFLVCPNPPKKINLRDDYIRKVHLYPDQHFLTKNDFQCFKITQRQNWYYQQFLKLRILEKLKYKEILLLDGDSLISESLLELYDNNELTCINRKLPYPYIEFLNRINISPSSNNFISNEMKFNKEVLLEFLKSVEDTAGIKWEFALANAINDNSWLSEYQAYGSYFLQNYPDTRVKQIKSFRRFDLIKDNFTTALEYYDLIAVEKMHKTNWLKKFIINLLYKFKFPLG